MCRFVVSMRREENVSGLHVGSSPAGLDDGTHRWSRALADDDRCLFSGLFKPQQSTQRMRKSNLLLWYLV